MRKVLGARVPGIVLLLSKDFIKLIIYAGALAILIGWYISGLLLQAFTFRIAMNFWVFIGALLFVIILDLITISTQSVKAALTNPVDSLVYE